MNKDTFWDVAGTIALIAFILLLAFLPEVVEVMLHG